jgi:glycosyltransferase involved in cell wall biosynthesis
MRLCVYSPSLGEVVVGGAETFGREVASRLAARHEVHVVCGGSGDQPPGLGKGVGVHAFPYVGRSSWQADLFRALTLYRLDAFWLESLSLLPSARAHIERERYDLVAVHYPPDARVRGAMPRGALVVHFHGYPTGGLKCRVYRRILEEARADAAISCSRFVAERVEETLGVESEVVHNGVDTAAFSPGPPDGELAEALRLAGKRAVLFLGRFTLQKGADTLLRALALLPEDVVAVMVGGGPLEGRLRSLARRLGVAERTRFVGVVARRELPRLYRASRALAVPSNMEPLGIVAIEAMACGLPVVASAVGGLPELVDEGVGRLVPPHDPAALARALGEVLDDEALARRLGARGRRKALGMGWDAVAARVEDIYLEASRG